MKSKLLQVVVILLCGVAAFASMSFRLGGVAPSDFIDAAPEKLPATWQTPHPDTLIALSEQALATKNLDGAKKLAISALDKNITSGKATAQLLLIYEQQGQKEEANKFANLSDSLWPAHTYTRSRLANYWLRQENLAKVLPEWNVLLIQDPGLRKQLYPVLQNIANEPSLMSLLLPYIQAPPTWWNSFFSYLVSKNEQLDTIRAIYQARIDSEQPLDNTERRSYVYRLLKENLWDEAYFSWLGGLNPAQLELSGLLYDGGFEGESFSTGFDWEFGRAKGVQIKTGTTNGMTGKHALRIQLDSRQPIHFQHVSQRLALQAGDYQFSVRYRLDRLQTSEGLRWRIRCMPEQTTIVMESELLAGRSPWNTLESQFSIPAGCLAQIIRLEASSKYAHHQEFKGSLWFDDLSITRQVVNATVEPKE